MLAYLPRIQMLRFAAAAMVLVGHAQHRAREVAGMDLSSYRTIGGAAFYASGVDVFFVLSGFIMYAISRHEFGRAGAPADFIWRRLARIAPPYWAFTTAMLAATVMFAGRVSHGSLDAAHVIGSYLFIPTRDAQGDLYPLLILGWTLNFEMLFYVIFAFGLRWPQARGMAFIFAAVSGLGLAGLVLEPPPAPLAFWCNPIVFEFLFGIALARVHASGWRCSPAVGAAVLGLGIVLLHFGSARSAPSPFWPERAIWMGLPALVICAAVALTREAASPGLVSRALAFAGDASYVLYLSHPFTLAAIGLLAPRWGLRDPWSFVGLACVACIAVSAVLHRYVERPTVAALNRRIRQARPGVAAKLPVMAPESGGRP